MEATEQTPVPGTDDAMTAEDHIREARRYAASAEEYADAVSADAVSYERIARRANDLQAAQVHATLAQTLTAAVMMPLMAALVESITPAQPGTAASHGDQEVPSP